MRPIIVASGRPGACRCDLANSPSISDILKKLATSSAPRRFFFFFESTAKMLSSKIAGAFYPVSSRTSTCSLSQPAADMLLQSQQRALINNGIFYFSFPYSMLLRGHTYLSSEPHFACSVLITARRDLRNRAPFRVRASKSSPRGSHWLVVEASPLARLGPKTWLGSRTGTPRHRRGRRTATKPRASILCTMMDDRTDHVIDRKNKQALSRAGREIPPPKTVADVGGRTPLQRVSLSEVYTGNANKKCSDVVGL